MFTPVYFSSAIPIVQRVISILPTYNLNNIVLLLEVSTFDKKRVSL